MRQEHHSVDAYAAADRSKEGGGIVLTSSLPVALFLMCRLITVSYPAIKSLSVALNPSPPSTVGIEKYHRKTVRVRRETNRFAQGEDEEREEEG